MPKRRGLLSDLVEAEVGDGKNKAVDLKEFAKYANAKELKDMEATTVDLGMYVSRVKEDARARARKGMLP